MPAVTTPVAATTAPKACPFCRSSRIGAPTQKVDASTYWRCEACGQMWNEDRLRATSGYGYQPRWR